MDLADFLGMKVKEWEENFGCQQLCINLNDLSARIRAWIEEWEGIDK